MTTLQQFHRICTVDRGADDNCASVVGKLFKHDSKIHNALMHFSQWAPDRWPTNLAGFSRNIAARRGIPEIVDPTGPAVGIFDAHKHQSFAAFIPNVGYFALGKLGIVRVVDHRIAAVFEVQPWPR